MSSTAALISVVVGMIGIGHDVEARVAEAAGRMNARSRLVRADCSGLVDRVLRDARAGANGATVRELWDDAVADGRIEKGAPRPGHLVFFDRTYDANGDGRVNDRLTHVAVVVKVDGDVVEMVHHDRRGVRRVRMSLARRDVFVERGVVVNDVVRRAGYGRPGAPRLAGQLYRGHARPPFAAPRDVVEKVEAVAAGSS